MVNIDSLKEDIFVYPLAFLAQLDFIFEHSDDSLLSTFWVII